MRFIKQLISRGLNSEYYIVVKCKEHNMTNEQIQNVLESLYQKQLIRDEIELGRELVEELSLKGYGPYRVRQSIQKYISPQNQDKVFSIYKERYLQQALEKAVAIIMKLLQRYKDNVKVNNKLLNKLYSLGYDFDMAQIILTLVTQSNKE